MLSTYFWFGPCFWCCSCPMSLLSAFTSTWEKLLLQTFASLCFVLFFPWPSCTTYGILVPWTGIKPKPSAMKLRTPNQWTSRKFPFATLLMRILFEASSVSTVGRPKCSRKSVPWPELPLLVCSSCYHINRLLMASSLPYLTSLGPKMFLQINFQIIYSSQVLLPWWIHGNTGFHWGFSRPHNWEGTYP